MGNKSSKTLKKANNEINKQLSQKQSLEERTQKILLLGAGSSGKSTFLKQLKYLFIHNRGFPQEEKVLYGSFVYKNICEIIKASIEECEYNNIKHSKNSLESINFMKRLDLRIFGELYSENINDIIKHCTILWKDEGIKEVISRSNELLLMDNVEYFNNNINRILQPSYLATFSDILNTRIRTTGIQKETFDYDSDIKYLIFDVGGQRSERRKWIKIFSDISSVLFVISLNGYDQVLYEDENKNRLKEGIELLINTCKLSTFKNVNFNVFLNKKDLFDKKIKTKQFNLFKDEFKGNKNSSDDVIKFISQKIRKETNNKINIIRCTTAVNTNVVEKTFSQLHYLLVQNDLNSVGLL